MRAMHPLHQKTLYTQLPLFPRRRSSRGWPLGLRNVSGLEAKANNRAVLRSEKAVEWGMV